MKILWVVVLTFIATTYIVVGIIERECEWKGNFIRDGIIMPTVNIHCAARSNYDN